MDGVKTGGVVWHNGGVVGRRAHLQSGREGLARIAAKLRRQPRGCVAVRDLRARAVVARGVGIACSRRVMGAYGHGVRMEGAHGRRDIGT